MSGPTHAAASSGPRWCNSWVISCNAPVASALGENARMPPIPPISRLRSSRAGGSRALSPAGLVGHPNGRKLRRHLELAEDRLDLGAHRGFGDDTFLRDGAHRAPLDQPGQDLA